MKVYKNSKTGIKGIYFDSYKRKFRVCLAVNGRSKHFGTFETIEQAKEKLISIDVYLF